MEFYYLTGESREAFRRKYPDAKIDGVKIYRDGIITTPFAEQEDASDKKRDILGIDKRLWVSLFDKISTRELIGIVNITKEGNPQIIDATNRQDFTATPEYMALKDFIILQIEALEQFKNTATIKTKSQAGKKHTTCREPEFLFIVEKWRILLKKSNTIESTCSTERNCS